MVFCVCCVGVRVCLRYWRCFQCSSYRHWLVYQDTQLWPQKHCKLLPQYSSCHSHIHFALSPPYICVGPLPYPTHPIEVGLTTHSSGIIIVIVNGLFPPIFVDLLILEGLTGQCLLRLASPRRSVLPHSCVSSNNEYVLASREIWLTSVTGRRWLMRSIETVLSMHFICILLTQNEIITWLHDSREDSVRISGIKRK